MKTILIYTSPARGHLYPIMDVGMELKKQGNNVVIQTLADEKGRVENEGVKHISLLPEIEVLALEDYKESGSMAQFKSTFSTWLKRAPLEIKDLQKSYQQINPDLIIVDVNTWGAAAFAEAQTKPWLMFIPYCLPIASADTPAFGPGFAPPTNFFHRLRDNIVRKLINNAVGSHIAELNKIRNKMGISSLEKYDNIFDHPDHVLYRTAEPFDYSRKDLPKNILPIGPGLWAPKADEVTWIDDLPSPRILVSISTEKQDDGEIIETVFKAMARQNVSLIITTGALDPDQFNTQNENVRITKFLSHATILHKIDLLVTHGGMGSTQRALAAGVPVCVVPFGRDQRETAKRVEVSGSGAMLPKNKLNEKRLRTTIMEALNKKTGAEKIAQAFANAGGAKRAVEEIDRLLARNNQYEVVAK